MINELNTNTSSNNHLKQELLKFEIRKFTIFYCKQRTKKDERGRKYLENKLKNIENVLDNDDNLESYHNIKVKIEEINKEKAEGTRIRSKCLWYEEGEKSSKFKPRLENLQLTTKKLQIRTKFRMNSYFSMNSFQKHVSKHF